MGIGDFFEDLQEGITNQVGGVVDAGTKMAESAWNEVKDPMNWENILGAGESYFFNENSYAGITDVEKFQNAQRLMKFKSQDEIAKDYEDLMNKGIIEKDFFQRPINQQQVKKTEDVRETEEASKNFQKQLDEIIKSEWQNANHFQQTQLASMVEAYASKYKDLYANIQGSYEGDDFKHSDYFKRLETEFAGNLKTLLKSQAQKVVAGKSQAEAYDETIASMRNEAEKVADFGFEISEQSNKASRDFFFNKAQKEGVSLKGLWNTVQGVGTYFTQGAQEIIEQPLEEVNRGIFGFYDTVDEARNTNVYSNNAGLLEKSLGNMKYMGGQFIDGLPTFTAGVAPIVAGNALTSKLGVYSKFVQGRKIPTMLWELGQDTIMFDPMSQVFAGRGMTQQDALTNMLFNIPIDIGIGLIEAPTKTLFDNSLLTDMSKIKLETQNVSDDVVNALREKDTDLAVSLLIRDTVNKQKGIEPKNIVDIATIPYLKESHKIFENKANKLYSNVLDGKSSFNDNLVSYLGLNAAEKSIGYDDLKKQSDTFFKARDVIISSLAGKSDNSKEKAAYYFQTTNQEIAKGGSTTQDIVNMVDDSYDNLKSIGFYGSKQDLDTAKNIVRQIYSGQSIIDDTAKLNSEVSSNINLLFGGVHTALTKKHANDIGYKVGRFTIDDGNKMTDMLTGKQLDIKYEDITKRKTFNSTISKINDKGIIETVFDPLTMNPVVVGNNKKFFDEMYSNLENVSAIEYTTTINSLKQSGGTNLSSKEFWILQSFLYPSVVDDYIKNGLDITKLKLKDTEVYKFFKQEDGKYILNLKNIKQDKLKSFWGQLIEDGDAQQIFDNLTTLKRMDYNIGKVKEIGVDGLIEEKVRQVKNSHGQSVADTIGDIATEYNDIVEVYKGKTRRLPGTLLLDDETGQITYKFGTKKTGGKGYQVGDKRQDGPKNKWKYTDEKWDTMKQRFLEQNPGYKILTNAKGVEYFVTRDGMSQYTLSTDEKTNQEYIVQFELSNVQDIPEWVSIIKKDIKKLGDGELIRVHEEGKEILQAGLLPEELDKIKFVGDRGRNILEIDTRIDPNLFEQKLEKFDYVQKLKEDQLIGKIDGWNTKGNMSQVLNDIKRFMPAGWRLDIVPGLANSNGDILNGMADAGRKVISINSEVLKANTGSHEALHAYLSEIAPKERQQILNIIKEKFNVEGEKIAEEILADHFYAYIKDRVDVGLGKKILNFFKDLYEKIFLDKGTKKIKNLYNDIVSGKKTTGFNTRAGQYAEMVWHGSPYDFDTFDESKFLSGEGAMVYGRGFYVAKLKGVADHYAVFRQPKPVEFYKDIEMEEIGLIDDYRDSWYWKDKNGLSEIYIEGYRDLYKNHITGDFYFPIYNNDIEELVLTKINYKKLQRIGFKGDEKDIISILYDAAENGYYDIPELNRLGIGKYFKEATPTLYRIEIPDDNGNNYVTYLNNDLLIELGKEYLTSIGKIDEILKSREGFQFLGNKLSWEENVILNHVKSNLLRQEDYVKFLQNKGYIGIRYPSQSYGRRTINKNIQEDNFVIFSSRDIKIVSKELKKPYDIEDIPFQLADSSKIGNIVPKHKTKINAFQTEEFLTHVVDKLVHDKNYLDYIKTIENPLDRSDFVKETILGLTKGNLKLNNVTPDLTRSILNEFSKLSIGLHAIDNLESGLQKYVAIFKIKYGGDIIESNAKIIVDGILNKYGKDGEVNLFDLRDQIHNEKDIGIKQALVTKFNEYLSSKIGFDYTAVNSFVKQMIEIKNKYVNRGYKYSPDISKDIITLKNNTINKIIDTHTGGLEELGRYISFIENVADKAFLFTSESTETFLKNADRIQIPSDWSLAGDKIKGFIGEDNIMSPGIYNDSYKFYMKQFFDYKKGKTDKLREDTIIKAIENGGLPLTTDVDLAVSRFFLGNITKEGYDYSKILRDMDLKTNIQINDLLIKDTVFKDYISFIESFKTKEALAIVISIRNRQKELPDIFDVIYGLRDFNINDYTKGYILHALYGDGIDKLPKEVYSKFFMPLDRFILQSQVNKILQHSEGGNLFKQFNERLRAYQNDVGATSLNDYDYPLLLAEVIQDAGFIDGGINIYKAIAGVSKKQREIIMNITKTVLLDQGIINQKSLLDIKDFIDTLNHESKMLGETGLYQVLKTDEGEIIEFADRAANVFAYANDLELENIMDDFVNRILRKENQSSKLYDIETSGGNIMYDTAYNERTLMISSELFDEGLAKTYSLAGSKQKKYIEQMIKGLEQYKDTDTLKDVEDIKSLFKQGDLTEDDFKYLFGGDKGKDITISLDGGGNYISIKEDNLLDTGKAFAKKVFFNISNNIKNGQFNKAIAFVKIPGLFDKGFKIDINNIKGFSLMRAFTNPIKEDANFIKYISEKYGASKDSFDKIPFLWKIDYINQFYKDMSKDLFDKIENKNVKNAIQRYSFNQQTGLKTIFNKEIWNITSLNNEFFDIAKLTDTGKQLKEIVLELKTSGAKLKDVQGLIDLLTQMKSLIDKSDELSKVKNGFIIRNRLIDNIKTKLESIKGTIYSAIRNANIEKAKEGLLPGQKKVFDEYINNNYINFSDDIDRIIRSYQTAIGLQSGKTTKDIGYVNSIEKDIKNIIQDIIGHEAVDIDIQKVKMVYTENIGGYQKGLDEYISNIEDLDVELLSELDSLGTHSFIEGKRYNIPSKEMIRTDSVFTYTDAVTGKEYLYDRGDISEIVINNQILEKELINTNTDQLLTTTMIKYDNAKTIEEHIIDIQKAAKKMGFNGTEKTVLEWIEWYSDYISKLKNLDEGLESGTMCE